MTLKSTDSFFSFSERADLTAIINSDKSFSQKDLFTQAKKIADLFKIPHISTGDIFRDNIKNGTDL